jgi:dephospho-CoA kinase
VLAKRAFSDSAFRTALNDRVHPRVRHALDDFFATHASMPMAVAVVPLIYESGIQDRFDVIWLVTAPEAVQQHRLMTTRGLSASEAMARIHSQMPLAEKLAFNPVVIPNGGLPEATYAFIDTLL